MFVDGRAARPRPPESRGEITRPPRSLNTRSNRPCGSARSTPSTARTASTIEARVAGQRDLDERAARRALLERRRRVELEQLAAIDDRDAVAELVRLLHVVRRHDDRATLVVQAAQDLP